MWYAGGTAGRTACLPIHVDLFLLPLSFFLFFFFFPRGPVKSGGRALCAEIFSFLSSFFFSLFRRLPSPSPPLFSPSYGRSAHKGTYTTARAFLFFSPFSPAAHMQDAAQPFPFFFPHGVFRTSTCYTSLLSFFSLPSPQVDPLAIASAAGSRPSSFFPPPLLSPPRSLISSTIV